MRDNDSASRTHLGLTKLSNKLLVFINFYLQLQRLQQGISPSGHYQQMWLKEAILQNLQLVLSILELIQTHTCWWQVQQAVSIFAQPKDYQN